VLRRIAGDVKETCNAGDTAERQVIITMNVTDACQAFTSAAGHEYTYITP